MSAETAWAARIGLLDSCAGYGRVRYPRPRVRAARAAGRPYARRLMHAVSQKSRKIPKSTRFEDALAELEGLVRELEDGDQPLDQSLLRFERGVSLVRFCRESLDAAEQQVRILMSESDDPNDETAWQRFEESDEPATDMRGASAEDPAPGQRTAAPGDGTANS